ncbi:hypothetical protein EYZ11_006703 [Aspergillus tanneri]|uniref:C2H2-type domain-containing protein n=1 Tax=Aspergillus tanneri TaxID=1220188 RepID=A0A4V3UP67_9EURO|nr:hypothetical protein EYZ11_006703 [Aspergillus tanneri]
MNDQLPPNFMEGARPRLSVRRARDPPKNAAGQIYCDHPECQQAPPTFRRPCEWNTGNGFTRQENLKEHLRRRHMHPENGHASDLPIVPTSELDGAPSLPPAPPAIKRKRDSLDEDPAVELPEDDEEVEHQNSVNLRNELKRLRREVQEKDRRLEELERIVSGLQQAIPQTAQG